MPFKPLRPFNRRKSSGNALEENPNPTSSFRVLDRPHEPSKSFDGSVTLNRGNDFRTLGEKSYNGSPDGRPSMNRGSNGTQDSASSGVYNSSSSAHYSSTSTLPSASSADAAHEDSQGYFKSKSAQTQNAPSGFSLRAAGRTFSFGARKSMQAHHEDIAIPQQHHQYADIPDIQPGLRQRAMTDTSHASESTATPPKFLESDFSFGREEGSDDFANMFTNFGGEKRQSRNLVASPAASSSPDPYFSSEKPLPAPIRLVESQPVSPAPISNDSSNSRNGLLNLNAEPNTTTGFRRKPSPQLDPGEIPRSSPSPNAQQLRYGNGPPTGLRERAIALKEQATTRLHQRDGSDPTVSFLDEDTSLAMQYMDRSRRPDAPPKRKSLPPIPRKAVNQQPSAAERDATLRPGYTFEDGTNQDFQSPDSADNSSIMTTPKANKVAPAPYVDGLHRMGSLQEMALYADRFEEQSKSAPRPQSKPVSTGKVMTPAQFEMYKKERETRRLDEDSDSESDKSESEEEGEDDEEERNREMARQRRKQEADLAVYRQKMMKLTGEPASLRPASQSTPNVTGKMPELTLQNLSASDGKSSEGDEDEDVPLAVLAAHGFPNKNRPPSTMNRQSTRPVIQYQSETYPPPPASVSGQSTPNGPAGGRTLPPFARNLPKDPYFGASLVTPSDRQSLAFGSGAQSIYGGSSVGTGGPPGGHPGGLVGVIAKEEKARALRRGSPNAGGNFEASGAAAGLSPFGMAPNFQPGMLPGMPPPMTPDQQAQMQMTQQMTQMMQMQMQWMQQMMQMQGGQGMPNMSGMPNMPPGMADMLAAQGMPPRPGSAQQNPNPRPQSSGRAMTMGARASTTGQPGFGSNAFGRSSANLGPSPGPGTGYAPSLAPSERSNIGQPSRYRPVSTVPPDGDGGYAAETGSLRGTRTSTMGSLSAARASTFGPGAFAGPAGQRASTFAEGTRNSAMMSGGLSPSEAQPRRPAAQGRVSFGGATTSAMTKGKNTLSRVFGRSAEDEDDEEGWAEMRRRRENKKDTWKEKRVDSRLGREEGLEGLEGIYYPTD